MFQVKTSFNALRRLGVLVCVAGSVKSCLAVFTDIFGVPRVPKCSLLNGRELAGIAARN